MFRKTLDSHIKEMKATARALVSYSYPNVKVADELDIACLKQRSLHADGYQVVVILSRAEYNENYIDTLEIVGLHVPFLPTYMVCKLAKKFLGDSELRYSEAFKMGRKIYIWSVTLDKNEKPIAINDGLSKCSYDGFNYSYYS